MLFSKMKMSVVAAIFEFVLNRTQDMAQDEDLVRPRDQGWDQVHLVSDVMSMFMFTSPNTDHTNVVAPCCSVQVVPE